MVRASDEHPVRTMETQVVRSRSLSFELILCEPGGAHSMAICTMETPDSRRSCPIHVSTVAIYRKVSIAPKRPGLMQFCGAKLSHWVPWA